MKKQDVLNKREEELMNFLWAYNEPLTQNEMAERLEEQGWSSVTLFKTVQSLSGTSVKGNLVATAITVCLLIVSYSFVLQSKYECPIEEIETDDISYSVDNDNSYITFQDGEYILHSGQKVAIVPEEMVQMMIEEGFPFIE